MNDITILNYQSSPVRFERRGDLLAAAPSYRIWVSLSDMAVSADKRVNNWGQLPKTIDYLNALDAVTGIPVAEAIQGTPQLQGTWGIEEVALDFAAWCSVDLRIWLYQQIKALRSTLQVELQPELPKAIPASLETILKGIELLPAIASPILQAALEQRLAEELKLSDTLSVSQPKPVLAAALARELGFSLRPGEDAQLGLWVKKFHEPARKKGKRYKTNLYNRTPELEKTIRIFFS